MKLLLKRTLLASDATIGMLSIDGKVECFTLEDRVRADGIKIHGETAIPAGAYVVDITMSPRFGRQLPLLLDVKGFSGIRIHPGNDSRDTEGCVLVGQQLGPDRTILKSRAAFEPLFAKLVAAKARHEPITLTITNEGQS